jgi:hypothetical protein
MRHVTPNSIDTRKAAHASILPLKRRVYADILDFARDQRNRGLIADELSAAWGCSHNHVAPRIRELVELGELVDSGRLRKTRTGRSAHVFVLPEFTEELSTSAAPTNQVALSPSPDGPLGLPSHSSLFGDLTPASRHRDDG